MNDTGTGARSAGSSKVGAELSKPEMAAPSVMLIVILLSFIAPLSIDIVLPASKLIADQFGVGVINVQSGLTYYLIAFALASFFHGALADAYGRRTVAIMALALYTLGALVSAAAHSVEILYFGRLLQGCSAGAGVIVGRAIISDLFDGVSAKRRLATISMMLSLPPAVAPVIGGWLSHAFGWRSNFLLLGVLTSGLACTCLFALRETLPPSSRRPFHLRYMVRTYCGILFEPRFLCLTGAATALLAGQFIFIAGSASILITHYKLTEVDFWRLFVPITLGVAFGGVAGRYLMPRMRESKYIALALGITLCASVADVLVASAVSGIRDWTFAPSFFYALGMLLVLPVMFGTCLAERSEVAGAVSASQVFLQFTAVAVVTGIFIPLVAYSLLVMSVLKVGFVLLGVLLWFIRPERSETLRC